MFNRFLTTYWLDVDHPPSPFAWNVRAHSEALSNIIILWHSSTILWYKSSNEAGYVFYSFFFSRANSTNSFRHTNIHGDKVFSNRSLKMSAHTFNFYVCYENLLKNRWFWIIWVTVIVTFNCLVCEKAAFIR